jgi:hypothetical protein
MFNLNGLYFVLLLFQNFTEMLKLFRVIYLKHTDTPILLAVARSLWVVSTGQHELQEQTMKSVRDLVNMLVKNLSAAIKANDVFSTIHILELFFFDVICLMLCYFRCLFQRSGTEETEIALTVALRRMFYLLVHFSELKELDYSDTIDGVFESYSKIENDQGLLAGNPDVCSFCSLIL